MSEPLVLGIETSCDETGVGIVRGHTLLADAVACSVEEHARFGGVVPEVASRAHLEAMVPTIERACETAGIRLDDVDAIAVTSGPGLAGALLVGRRRRQGAGARARQADLRRQPPRRPRRGRPARARAAARALPGDAGRPAGTPSLLRVADVTVGVEPLGATIDDAAGEAFDKVARLLGLPFPGRPAHRPRGGVGLERVHRLPARADLAQGPRAAPLRLLVLRAQDRGGALGRGPRALPASRCRSPTSRRRFQEAVCDVLTRKAIDAAATEGIEDILIGGGVAANSRLRAMAEERAAAAGIRVRVPRPGLCTDNGAMVAALGAEMVARGPDALGARPPRRLLPADHHRRRLIPPRVATRSSTSTRRGHGVEWTSRPRLAGSAVSSQRAGAHAVRHRGDASTSARDSRTRTGSQNARLAGG